MQEGLLQPLVTYCSPTVAASARLVRRDWRVTFSTVQDSLRLDSQRPTGEAAALLGAHAFHLARRASLELAATPVAGSQAQVDAWLHALRQRTAITQLTLHCATDPLIRSPYLAAERLPAQRPLASLAQLAPLQHLRSLTLHLTPAWCDTACEAVSQLSLLTRLQVATLASQRAALALAAALRGGMPQLHELELCFGAALDGPAVSTPTHTWAQPLLQAAATGCPHLCTLLCRGNLNPLSMMATIATATTAAAATATTAALAPAAAAAAPAAACGPRTAALTVTCTGFESRTIRIHTHPPTTEAATALRGVSGVAATATLHVVAGELIEDEDLTLCCGDPVGFTFSVAAAALCDARRLLQRLHLPPLTTALEGLTYTMRHDRGDHFLDLSLLPPTLTSFAARIHEVVDWPPISGTAPSLTALELSWRHQEACTVQGAALAALAAGCANLQSLTLLCDMPSAAAAAAAWAPLAALQRLTHLSLSAATDTSVPQASFGAEWLPSSLVSLRLHSVQVAAEGPPPRLPVLMSLHLSGCRVRDLNVFAQAHSLRSLTALDTAFHEGGEALLGFVELEELWETASLVPQQPAFVQAAAAAATDLRPAAAVAGKAAATLLPRLRFLSLSDLALGGEVPQLLLLRLSHVRRLRVDVPQGTPARSPEWPQWCGS